MRVLIVGSIPDAESADGHSRYQEACRDLGMALSQRGWAIGVGTDRSDTADKLVVEGAQRSGRRTNIIVHYHDKEPVPFESRALREHGAGQTPPLTFQFRHGPGNWVSGRIEEIQQCDAMLLIGGSDKTAQAFHTAKALRKACVPIPGLGGASGELWNTFVASIQHLPLQPNDLRGRIEPWQGNISADAVLKFVKRYVDTKPYSAENKAYRSSVLIILAFAILGWAWLYFGQAPAGRYTVFGVMVTSSVMGAGLHWFLTLLGRHESQASAQFSWARAGAAIIEAFALFLFLLVGAVTIDGNVSFLDSLGNRGDFMRVAAVVSLFGLAAGFMTESISKALAKRFIKLVANESDNIEDPAHAP